MQNNALYFVKPQLIIKDSIKKKLKYIKGSASLIVKLIRCNWPSYAHNALGKADRLISEHSLYKALGDGSQPRYKSYQKIFDRLVILKEENLITEATLRGEVYGTNGFHQKISQLISRSTKLATHGGDRKSEIFKDQAG